MSQSIGLSTYVIRIRKKREDELLILDNFDGKNSFFEAIQSFLTNNDNYHFDKASLKLNKRLEINSNYTLDGRAIDGTFEYGEDGIFSEFKGAQGEHKFTREEDDAEMIPLYYRIWCPENQNFGVMVLQSFGIKSCKTAFCKLMDLYFQDYFPHYKFIMSEAVTREQIKEYLENGRVKEFKFLNHGVPEDWANGYGGEALSEEIADLEVKIKARKNQNLPLLDKLSEFISGKSTLKTTQLFEMNNFLCDDFKLKLDLDGQSKTLGQTELVSVNSRKDITTSIKLNGKGHPIIESIRPVATDLINNLADNIRSNK